MRTLVKDERYLPMFANGIAMLGGGLLALPTSLVFEGIPTLTIPATSKQGGFIFGHLLYYTTPYIASIGTCVILGISLILIANVIGYNLQSFLLRTYTATFLSFAGFITPLFAAFYGWLFLGELVSWDFFATIMIVFIGLYLFYRQELAQGYIQRT
jgi:drug/metabolite transporter (DMT)-like permease